MQFSYSFPFGFEPNGIPFGSKSEGKLSPRSYPIQFEMKWEYSFLRAKQIYHKLQGPRNCHHNISRRTISSGEERKDFETERLTGFISFYNRIL